MSERHPVEEEPINWRRTDDGVTIYDETAPDAWIHVTLRAGVPPGKQLLAICPECGAVLACPGQPGGGTVCGECGTAFDHARGEAAPASDPGAAVDADRGTDRGPSID